MPLLNLHGYGRVPKGGGKHDSVQCCLYLGKQVPAVVNSPVVGEEQGGQQWLTSMWEPGGMVPSCHMIMVMKLLLCGISRPDSGWINGVCANRDNEACIIVEEKENQYQMHHKQDDCETRRWPWWEQGPCPVTYPERYHSRQLGVPGDLLALLNYWCSSTTVRGACVSLFVSEASTGNILLPAKEIMM